MQDGQYDLLGSSAAELVERVESGVNTGALRPGQVLPSVRRLAQELALSPTTVAAAYRELRRRGVVVTHDRARTVVAHRPALHYRLAPHVPEGAVDLATGNPDPALLPSLAAAIRSLPTNQHRYTDDVQLPELLDVAGASFRADGVPTDDVVIVGGGLDGIERVLMAWLRPGDRIAVEDPGYPGALDLVRTLGLDPVGLEMDDEGPLPVHLDAALRTGAAALLVTPRAQNPTGAALTAERADVLRRVIAAHPDVLVVEDDHAAPITGLELHTLTTGRARWAVIRSVAKWLGPQLRVAGLAADRDTATRVLARQRLGTGWVSQLLQHVVAVTWAEATASGALAEAAATYDRRRVALLDALAERGCPGRGRTGLNVWVEVDEEVPVVQGMAERGWAVAAGEPFRLAGAPGIRITTAALATSLAGEVAADLTAVLGQRLPGRRG